jgi:hypothetical protein
MEFDKIPDDQVRAFRDTIPTMKRITDRSDHLLELLIKACEDWKILREAKIEISRGGPGAAIASIKTPFGNGRILLGWMVSEQALLGHFVVERECHNKYEQLYWEAIWGLKIPEYEDPFASSLQGGFRVQLNDHFGDSLPGEISTCVLSMVYGIVNGSVLAKR